MDREVCGFILFEWILSNGIAWLFGYDLSTKDKILIPNVLMFVIFMLVIALKWMGVE